LLASSIILTTQRRPPSRDLRLTVLTIRPAIAGSTVRLSCTGARSCPALCLPHATKPVTCLR